MSKDLSLTTARVAQTPTQAKLFVAMLKAEGIHAFVEGDSLADEVAVSRQLMNVAGTHVRVRTEDLERAKEVLATVEIDEAELEAQAMAAQPAPGESAPRESASTPPWWLIGVAVVLIGVIIWQLLA